MWFVIAFVFVSLVNSAPTELRIQQNDSSEKCYGVLGCFRTDGPFFKFPNRPINLFPADRKKINTQFYLYTRDNPTKGQQLISEKQSSITQSSYKSSRDIKIIIHGFLENQGAPWIKEMTRELLKYGDFNVIVTSWQGGSGFPYTQATANTRLVAAEIALLLQTVKSSLAADISTTHIIGHSLGAHIAGYVGERLPIKRISGLDPAEPYFEGLDPVVRLDPNDATFVDVIHSDAESVFSGVLRGGWGLRDPVGHLDFYPNGGIDQPGCDQGVLTTVVTEGIYGGAKRFVACDHLRACDLYTESINSNCGFSSVPCSGEGDYTDGKCTSCGPDGCASMGFHADKFKKRTPLQKFYLKTFGKWPYCGFQYGVRITLTSDNSRSVRGTVSLAITGSKGSTVKRAISSAQDLEAGKSYGYLHIVPKDLGDITAVALEWDHDPKWYKIWNWGIFRSPTISLQKIEISSSDNKRFSFCASNKPVGDGVVTNLRQRCVATVR